jgi:hypothetical protein
MATKSYKEHIPLRKLSTKTKYTTRRLKMETQHLLCNNLSFKVNLQTSEDQNHSVQYLHSVKRTNLGHEPYIVHSITNLDKFSASILSRVYTSFLEL